MAKKEPYTAIQLVQAITRYVNNGRVDDAYTLVNREFILRDEQTRQEAQERQWQPLPPAPEKGRT